MAPGVATKVIGACCGLTAFAVGIVSGLAAGNPAETILIRALVALVCGNVAGYIVGAIGERTIAEAIENHGRKQAIPDAKPGLAGEPPSTRGAGLSA